MGWLYLPKTTPTAGQKGFTCGDVFVPIEGGTPPAYKKGICISNSYQKNESEMPSDGLVFHASLSEPSAASTGQMIESSSNVFYVNYQGMPCAKFDDSYLNYNYSDDFPTGKAPSTMSIWMNYSENQSFWPRIFSYGSNFSSRNRVIAFYENYQQFGSFSDDCSTLVGDSEVPKNKWNFVLITFDGSTFKLYIDAQLIGTASYSTIDTTLSKINIGSTNSGSNPYFGYLSTARIYNRVLSDDEIKLLSTEWQLPSIDKAFIPLEEVQPVEGAEYEKSSEEMPSEGLILHVPLAQSATADELGNELSETGNVAFTTVEGIQCAQFDGDSYIQFIVDLEKALSGSSTKVPFTATMWVYSQPSQYNSNTRGVFQYSTSVPENSNKTGVSIDTSTDGKIFGVDITDGFHFVAVTRDSTGTIKCYLDGVQVDASIDSLRLPDSYGYIGRVAYEEIVAEG